jgi:hypothetical protein
MLATIANLFRWLIQALITLIQFLVIVFLGILVAVIYALPWALRIGAILIWFYGAYVFVMKIDEVYASFSPEFPVMVLQFFVVIVQIGVFLSMLLLNLKLLWGALYFTGGIPLWIALIGIPKAFESWQHADFIFRILPPTLWAMMLIYTTIKGRSKRAGKQSFSVFGKLPRFVDLAFGSVDGYFEAILPGAGDDEDEEVDQGKDE